MFIVYQFLDNLNFPILKIQKVSTINREISINGIRRHIPKYFFLQNLNLPSILTSLLKSKNVGYKPNRAETFKGSNLKRFLDEAPDNVYLLMKVCI